MSYSYGNSKQNSAPAAVAPDMEDGLESGSVAVAKAFYTTHHGEIVQITDRIKLGRYFAGVQDALFEADAELLATCTKNGREDPRRHWRQVLYALRVNGRVLSVLEQGSYIDWKETSKSTPTPTQELRDMPEFKEFINKLSTTLPFFLRGMQDHDNSPDPVEVNWGDFLQHVVDGDDFQSRGGKGFREVLDYTNEWGNRVECTKK